MAKVRWHTMMSLDGFIAGPGDGMQWVFDVDGGEGQTADEVVRATGETASAACSPLVQLNSLLRGARNARIHPGAGV